MSNVVLFKSERAEGEAPPERVADAAEIERFLRIVTKHAAPGEEFSLCVGVYPNGKEHYWARPHFASIGIGVRSIAAGAARVATEAARAGVGDAGQTVAIRVCGLGAARKEKRPDEPSESDINVVFASFIAVEIDARPAASLRALKGVFGEPTMLIESGGAWTGPDGVAERKLHAYWRLSEAARSDEDLARLKTVRARACRLVDADSTGVSLGHPMRLPGTWHTKGEPRLCRIVGGDEGREIKLSVALQNVTEALDAAGLDVGGAASIARGERRGFKTQVPWLPEDLRRAAEVLPNDGLQWAEWNTVGMTFYDVSHAGPEGLEAFIAWSAKDTQGRHDEGYCERQWMHWYRSPPSLVSDESLDRRLRKHDPSWVPAASIVSNWYEPIEEKPVIEKKRGGILDDGDDDEVEEGEPDGVDNVTPLFGDRADDAAPTWLREMNRRHAFVLNNGQAVVANLDEDGSVTFSSRGSFVDVYANEQLKQGRVQTTKGEVWWAHPAREQFLKGVNFDPDGTPRGVFNLWRGLPPLPGEDGMSATEAAAGCALIRRHLEEVICAGDAKVYGYLLRWLAHMIQRPGEKPGVAVIVRGSKGSGKDTVGEYIGAMVGTYYVRASTMQQLVGRFNGHLKQCLFLHAEELVWDGSKQADSTLKSLITAQTMSFEDKGVRPIRAKSFTRVFATSNEEWVVPASEDERRYLMLEASSERARDFGWFGPLYDELRGVGPAALRVFLRSVDLAGFEVRDVPHTKALGEQKLQSLSLFDRWWFETIEAGLAFSGADDEPWETHAVRVEKDDLRDRFRAWCLKHREPAFTSEVAISKRLVHLTGQSSAQLTYRAKTEEGRVRLYVLPSLAKLRERWAEVYA